MSQSCCLSSLVLHNGQCLCVVCVVWFEDLNQMLCYSFFHLLWELNKNLNRTKKKNSDETCVGRVSSGQLDLQQRLSTLKRSKISVFNFHLEMVAVWGEQRNCGSWWTWLFKTNLSRSGWACHIPFNKRCKGLVLFQTGGWWGDLSVLQN